MGIAYLRSRGHVDSRAVFAAACCVFSATAAEARPASTGWYAEGGLGAVALLPPHADDAAIGPAINMRVGRDLFSWLSLGITLAASSHEATVPPPPEGEYFQLYRGGGDLRIGGRFGRIAIFVEGGLGITIISSNILGKVMVTDAGETFSVTFQGGAGLEYQLENRHYALGLATDAFLMPQFDALRAIDSRFYLRYTY
ncbi:MAG: outer membrane beta-barrel protein [Kofleriaceae bacterium]